MTFQHLTSLIAFTCAFGPSISLAQTLQSPTACAANSFAVIDLGAAVSVFDIRGSGGEILRRAA